MLGRHLIQQLRRQEGEGSVQSGQGQSSRGGGLEEDVDIDGIPGVFSQDLVVITCIGDTVSLTAKCRARGLK